VHPGPAFEQQPGSAWGPPPQVPPQRTERRGPGWGGVVAVGAGAALLSSLLTAGVVDRLDSSSAPAATTSTRSSTTTSAPLVSNGAPAPDWVAVAQATAPSVVSVRVNAGGGGGEGSGIVYDGKGHVLTNHHVIAAGIGGQGQVTVVLSDGRGYQASIVGSDPSTDLAVLQVKNPPAELKAAAFADSEAVKVGDPVMAAGNPLGLSDTVTTGIVSALDRPVRTQQESAGAAGGGDTVVTNAIQTDAAVNPGNSGGALVDAKGRVIGVTSSIASLRGGGGQAGSIGLGFAIPSNEARDVADQLLAGGKVQHAFLGVQLSDGTAQVNGAQRQAAQIRSVTPGSAADKAGLKTGDAVVAVNGEALEGADSLVARVRALRPGTVVTMSVVRDGATTDIKVTLGERPADSR
jgi:putative serine protease PepD